VVLLQFFFFFVYLSCHTTLTLQTARAQSEKHCRRRSASSGQKTRRGIEGEKPGRRRYREVILPERSLIEEKSSARPSPKSRRSVPQHPLLSFLSVDCLYWANSLNRFQSKLLGQQQINWRREKRAGETRSGNRAQRLCEKS